MRRGTFILVFFCAANLSAAQRTFVSAANGSDANPCTRALPCRSFAAALPLTDADGEAIVVDSGGYGPVTIAQSVSLISPNGVYAAITAPFGNAIFVNAGSSGHVVLKNLSLSSPGTADRGIRIDSAAAVYVESCAIGGFGLHGISFTPPTSTSRLYVSRTTIRGPGDGIYAAGGSRAVIDSVRVAGNYLGVDLDIGEQATIVDSVADGGHIGFFAHSGSQVTIDRSAATGNQQGFYVLDSGIMIMARCTAASNSVGVEADGIGSTIYASDSIMTRNASGVVTSAGGAVVSRGNNALQANTTNGAFTSTFSAQ